MNILHIFSNYKWTGPAEPAVNLAAHLKKRGHQVFLASGREPPGNHPQYVRNHAAEQGLEIVEGLRLDKHLRLVANLADAARLRGILEARKIDIIHAHLGNDHLIAALAARKMNRPPKIVRTFYHGARLFWCLRISYLLSRHTDHAIFCSRAVRDATARQYLLDRRKTTVLEGAVDIERFDPHRELRDIRSALGLGADDYVVGIVARVQSHRRFDVLLDAAEKAASVLPRFRLLIIGRGTNIETIARRPVLDRGVQSIVKFAGYLSGDDYVASLAALDAKVFLVPGSDGSCRAVREAMAMGVPVIAASRGMLPEIVDDGVVGRVIDDTADNLAQAFIELGDASRRRSMGAAARQRARRDFDIRRLAENVERIYEDLLNPEESISPHSHNGHKGNTEDDEERPPSTLS